MGLNPEEELQPVNSLLLVANIEPDVVASVKGTIGKGNRIAQIHQGLLETEDLKIEEDEHYH